MNYSTYFKTIIYVAVSILMTASVNAQSITSEQVLPLRVGDKVPEDFWTRSHLVYIDGDTVHVTLEEHRGKLLILDFWATWCGACKAWFPNNVRLQHEFGDDLKILLVNSDLREDYKHMKSVLHEARFFDGGVGSSIIYDQYLKSMFPHLPIPHYIWIDHRERVKAITNTEFVSSHQVKILIDKMNRANQGKK